MPELKNLVQTRIPTKHGEFTLHYYSNNIDNKEHVAFVKGEVNGRKDVPVRIHSECFTGDVLGSRRCDCGEQLDMALELMSHTGNGVLVYLRQEGRGIGLLKKLQAYNLQDQGMDTVDANIHLGHLPDEREYSLAALILNDLKVDSIKLITNNPHKIDDLVQLGVTVSSRIPIEPAFHKENLDYLKVKAEKMRHILSIDKAVPENVSSKLEFLQPYFDRLEHYRSVEQTTKPYVTVSYAQSADGSISSDAATSMPLSDRPALLMTHLLRAQHDAILVGINTVLVDNPQLNVRFCKGNDPLPVVLDCQLRFPDNAKLLSSGTKKPLVITTQFAAKKQLQRLAEIGVQVHQVAASSEGQADLSAVLKLLSSFGIKNVMVEGGAKVINEFFSQGLVDYCIITVAPKFIGGLKALDNLRQPPIDINNCQFHSLGTDLIIHGDIARDER